ncbi:MAG: hypothetical protein AAGF12_41135 [Myxococcota bacterium]
MKDGGGQLPAPLARSETETKRVLEGLRAKLQAHLGPWHDRIFGDHTTFVLTGSGGRGEMTDGSDIDGYVVRVRGDVDDEHDRKLEDALKAAVLELGLPPLDRDGEFVKMKTADALIDNMGSKKDDATDAFTARMLFLVESRPLTGEAAYEELFHRVSNAYRQPARAHGADFLPFYLVNDIVRYWRTVLLNHEDRLREKRLELSGRGLSEADLEAMLLANRRYRGQKLRFPRCLSCFSTLAYLLALAPSDHDSISIAQEREMFRLRPIDRLHHVAILQPRSRPRIERLLEVYAEYLERTNDSKVRILERLRTNEPFQREASRASVQFTEEMFHLIQDLGNGNRLHRHMLI